MLERQKGCTRGELARGTKRSKGGAGGGRNCGTKSLGCVVSVDEGQKESTHPHNRPVGKVGQATSR